MLWLVALGSAAATPEPTVLRFSVSARVDVAPDGAARVVEIGNVSKLSDLPALVPVANSIAQRLRERIETWQFVPAMKNGAPVASTTALYVGLEGRDDGHGGLAVSIRDASTGGDLRDVNVLALAWAVTKAQENARITVDVSYDETGKVSSVSEYESIFENAHSTAVNRDLRKLVLAAAKRWKFVPEKVDGQPIAGRGRVPITLCYTERCVIAPDQAGQRNAAPQFAATDPAVKLRSAVAGTAL